MKNTPDNKLKRVFAALFVSANAIVGGPTAVVPSPEKLRPRLSELVDVGKVPEPRKGKSAR